MQLRQTHKARQTYKANQMTEVQNSIFPGWGIYILLFTVFTAGLSMFFQLCMRKGMVFRPYKFCLVYFLEFKARNQNKTLKSLCTWLYKPLGGCLWCNSVWILILFYVPHCLFHCHLTWSFAVFSLPLAIGMQYIWLLVLQKHYA